MGATAVNRREALLNTLFRTKQPLQAPLQKTTHHLLRIGLLAIVVGVSGITGCATNPVTGKSELSLVSESWELRTGAQQYLPARRAKAETMSLTLRFRPMCRKLEQSWLQ